MANYGRVVEVRTAPMSDEVTRLLEELGLGEYARTFVDNAISFRALPALTEEDLKELGLKLGHRRILQQAVATLSDTPSPAQLEGKGGKSSLISPTGDAERRQLTVMFSDLVGSTALSQQLDPEDLREVNRAYQDACKGAIERFEGYVARYMGDGVLAYFGYPQAHEDDAERAVRAGLGVVEAMHEVNTNVSQGKGVELAVRVGIATGPVVVGDLIGEGASQESAVVGETPNLAARLQGLAKPNTVVIASTTQDLLGGLFHYEDLGAQALKGIANPVRAWEVTGEKAVESRFEATRAARGLTPLVGRKEEIRLLFKRWEAAQDGEGQVVLLSGEAGAGKSRILREVQDRLEGQLHSRVLYFGSPYHQDSALYPVIDQIGRDLRFERDDDPSKKLQKLESLVESLDLPAGELAPVIASMLSVPTGDRFPTLDLSPDELREKTLGALLAIIDAMAVKRPVLMVAEDAHWLDPSTLELLGLAIARLHRQHLLLVITFRPEFESPWGHQEHITALSFNRLNRRECVAMIRKVSGDAVLPSEIVETIVARTDGVPLFIEEFTKSVLESSLIQEADGGLETLPRVEIPASLHDSLMARLDRLRPVAKETSQLGAVLGRSFSHKLIAGASRLSQIELESAISELLNAELIYRSGVSPTVTYEFKHALVRDTAYASLLKRPREEYHLRVAEVLEKEHPQTLLTQPELVAQHYTEAGLAEKAVPLWFLASQHAIDRSAYKEANRQATKGISLISDLPQGQVRMSLEVDLHIAHSMALRAIKGFASPDVGQAYARARELCKQLGGEPQHHRIPELDHGLWTYYIVRSELTKAQDLAKRFVGSVETSGDAELLVVANMQLGVTTFYLGRLQLSKPHLLRAVKLYGPNSVSPYRLLYAVDLGVTSLSFLAMGLWLLGYSNQAAHRIEASLALSDKLSHPSTTAYALFYAGMVHKLRREPSITRKHAELATTLSEQHGFSLAGARGKILSGWALCAQGETDEGLPVLCRGLQAYESSGAVLWRPPFFSLLAEANMKGGNWQAARNALDDGLVAVDAGGESVFEAELLRLKGELSLVLGESNALAEEMFLRAIRVSQIQEAKSLELRAATTLARLWRDQGKRQEARDLLAPVYDWFTEGFDTQDLKDAKALLGELG